MTNTGGTQAKPRAHEPSLGVLRALLVAALAVAAALLYQASPAGATLDEAMANVPGFADLPTALTVALGLMALGFSASWWRGSLMRAVFGIALATAVTAFAYPYSGVDWLGLLSLASIDASPPLPIPLAATVVCAVAMGYVAFVRLDALCREFDGMRARGVDAGEVESVGAAAGSMALTATAVGVGVTLAASALLLPLGRALGGLIDRWPVVPLFVAVVAAASLGVAVVVALATRPASREAEDRRP